MLPNNNIPPNFTMPPGGMVMPQGYATPNPGMPQMTSVMYPVMAGQPQPFIGAVPAQFYPQQRPFAPHMVTQAARPRLVTDGSAPGARSSSFAAQQQKLKAFGIKGAKAAPVSVDNMIENMFGKAPQKVERTQTTVPVLVNRQQVSQPEPRPAAEPVSVPEPTPPVKKQAPVKSLEAMMQECTNMTASGNLRKSFGKGNTPAPKENKAHVRAPAQPPARFPAWCCQLSVPPLYRQVEQLVSVEGQAGEAPQYDNTRLLPVLMSSGLPKDVLARLWELVSQTQPGSLAQKELYAILALVALSQAGYQVLGPEVLLMLGTPPIPSLVLPQSVPIQEQPPQPTTPPVDQTHSTQPTATQEISTATSGQGTVSSEDDEFDDFKQATWVSPPQQTAAASLPSAVVMPVVQPPKAGDKYAAFLELESQFTAETEEPTPVCENTVDDFGDFLSADPGVAPQASQLPFFSTQPANISETFHLPASTFPEQTAQPTNSDFGAFSCSVFGTEAGSKPFEANFADFESQSQEAFAASPTNEDSPEDDFTLFSHRGLLRETRLAETQSVASLELTSNVEHLSHHGSSQSLDSKNGQSLSGPTDEPPKHHQRSVSDGQGLVVKALASMSLECSESSISLVDRYSSICNEKTKVGISCIQELGRCLTCCLKLLEAGAKIFEQMSSTDVFHEVLAAKEVLDYIQNVKEVYTVTQRIRVATARAVCPADVQKTLENIQKAWDTLVNIILSSDHPSIPSDLKSPWLEFSSAVILVNDMSRASCGVCLLDVDDSSATCWNDSVSALVKLSYSRQQYHATCANLWLNCVDPILPAFTLQELYSQ